MGSSLLAPNKTGGHPKLLDINDVLIVQPIRDIFNEVGFEAELTVCEGCICFIRQSIDDSGDGFVHFI